MAMSSQKGDRSSKSPLVSLICPVFNEEGLLEAFVERALDTLSATGHSFEILFVDDGSTDATWSRIVEISSSYSEVRGIRLARNFGKEVAVTAGLAEAHGQAHIPIDVDFQDPLELIPEMISLWQDGFTQVIPRRSTRSDSGLRRIGAAAFYRLIGWLTTNSVPKEVGDFRLLDASMTERFLSFPEKRRVNKVIFSQLGGNSTFIDFERPNTEARRHGGQSLSKLVDLGIAAVASNSVRLSRAVLTIGVIGLFLGISLSLAVFILWWLGVIDVPGQATVLMVGTIIVAVQLISASFLGLVIAESLRETQNRPLYFIDEVTD